MGDSYFKTNLVFYRIDSVFSLNQLGFFSVPTQLLYRTDSIAWTEPINSVFLENQSTRLSYRTYSIILQNRLDYFTEPAQFFHWTDSVFSLNQLGFFTEPTRGFFIIKQGAHPQPPVVSCKRTCSFMHARLLSMQSHQDSSTSWVHIMWHVYTGISSRSSNQQATAASSSSKQQQQQPEATNSRQQHDALRARTD